jgi:hypothetical protein
MAGMLARGAFPGLTRFDKRLTNSDLPRNSRTSEERA